jgi:hypothetical protein
MKGKKSRISEHDYIVLQSTLYCKYKVQKHLVRPASQDAKGF